MKILILTRWFPHPPNNGSKIRIYNLLCCLAEKHEITLISFHDQAVPDTNSPEIRSLCRDIRRVPWREYNPLSTQALAGFFSLKPRSAIDTYSIEMEREIDRAVTEKQFDLVIASETAMGAYVRSFHKVPALLEDIELGVLHDQYALETDLFHRLRYGLTWTKHQHYLNGLLKGFRACTVVSSRERDLLAHVTPEFEMVEVIPNCVDVEAYADTNSESLPEMMIFTGSFSYSPNFEAMNWFVTEVLPKIKREVPGAQLIITGDQAGKTLPVSLDVTQTGFVEDVRPWIASSGVSLAPIWTGGGTRLKILEAMALHTPVVATSKGAEGLDVQNGKHLLIADTPESFAEAVIHLIKDRDLRQILSINAFDLVSQKYNWAAVMPRFLNLVERVARN